MKMTACMGVAAVAAAFALVACGGGSTPGGGGGSTSAGGGSSEEGAGSSTTGGMGGMGGDPTSASSSASGSSSSGPPPSPGIHCTFGTTPLSFPKVDATPVQLTSGVVFGSFTPTDEVSIAVGGGLKNTGIFDCGATTSVSFTRTVNNASQDFFSNGVPGTGCTIELTHVPAAKGDSWIGTFSAQLVGSDDTTMVKVTGGTINVVY